MPGSRHVCPRCHLPLDDQDGSIYVCCAGETLQWRCDGCGKVSEGFAFPYGQCPYCNGHLVRNAGGGPIDPDNERATEAIRVAFEIELGGQAYYRAAADAATDPHLAELFDEMADREAEHIQTLKRRYHTEVPEPPTDFATDRAAIFAGMESHPEDPANLLKLALAFEQRAVEYFEKHIADTPEGSDERALYEELAAEEREHVNLLASEFGRFKADLGYDD